jgi:hypothetical protein
MQCAATWVKKSPSQRMARASKSAKPTAAARRSLH